MRVIILSLFLCPNFLLAQTDIFENEKTSQIINGSMLHSGGYYYSLDTFMTNNGFFLMEESTKNRITYSNFNEENMLHYSNEKIIIYHFTTSVKDSIIFYKTLVKYGNQDVFREVIEDVFSDSRDKEIYKDCMGRSICLDKIELSICKSLEKRLIIISYTTSKSLNSGEGLSVCDWTEYVMQSIKSPN